MGRFRDAIRAMRHPSSSAPAAAADAWGGAGSGPLTSGAQQQQQQQQQQQPLSSSAVGSGGDGCKGSDSAVLPIPADVRKTVALHRSLKFAVLLKVLVKLLRMCLVACPIP